MLKKLCFDMDGTLNQFYSVPNWLNLLRAYDPLPYAIATPMWNMARLANLLRQFQKKGIEVNIITWLSMESTPEYDRATREAKKEWLNRYDFPYDHFHGVKYGATKADSVRKRLSPGEEAILIDDNAKVRDGWHLGRTIDPTSCDLLDILEELLKGEAL